MKGWLAIVCGGGWVEFRHVEPTTVFVRFEANPSSGRLEAHDVLVRSSHRIDSPRLREIPLGQFEAQVNSSGMRELVLQHLDHSDDEAAAMKKWLATIASTADPVVSKRPRLRLPRPPRQAGALPDFFYERVAECYAWLSGPGRSRRPAVEIAKANEVPVSTAHRWIREARSRGFLPPARKGSSG